MNNKLNIKSLDDHHSDVFNMVQQLDQAILKNQRPSFEPIIHFLEHHCIEHFEEEETLMKKNQFALLTEHETEHYRFKHKIKTIRKTFNENIHTTHIAYQIRQFIDQLIIHIQTIDVKLKGLSHE